MSGGSFLLEDPIGCALRAAVIFGAILGAILVAIFVSIYFAVVFLAVYFGTIFVAVKFPAQFRGWRARKAEKSRQAKS
jgi:hypothetical protein